MRGGAQPFAMAPRPTGLTHGELAACAEKAAAKALQDVRQRCAINRSRETDAAAEELKLTCECPAHMHSIVNAARDRQHPSEMCRCRCNDEAQELAEACKNLRHQ